MELPTAVELLSNLIAEEPEAEDAAGVLKADVPFPAALFAIIMFELILSAWDKFGVEKTEVPVADVNGLRIILFEPEALDILRI